jgi:hypothetical protein
MGFLIDAVAHRICRTSVDTSDALHTDVYLAEIIVRTYPSEGSMQACR